ncbi:MAG: hypothetical protein ACK4VI_01795 [Alphaproteobacteria bacterium]
MTDHQGNNENSSANAATPQTNTPQIPDDINQEFAHIRSLIDSAGQNAQKSPDFTMADIQNKVTALCNTVVRLPAPQAKACQPQLAKLIQSLDTLEKALREGAKS